MPVVHQVSAFEDDDFEVSVPEEQSAVRTERTLDQTAGTGRLIGDDGAVVPGQTGVGAIEPIVNQFVALQRDDLEVTVGPAFEIALYEAARAGCQMRDDALSSPVRVAAI